MMLPRSDLTASTERRCLSQTYFRPQSPAVRIETLSPVGRERERRSTETAMPKLGTELSSPDLAAAVDYCHAGKRKASLTDCYLSRKGRKQHRCRWSSSGCYSTQGEFGKDRDR
ncbi:unnamed protein product [Cuscuta epithymum]|uniref:Uncharacterized protein n=1 Tax=Cuscuta epithymum TaxID=186058 RepID=A0AAV0DBD2_9ASTE|nr:unnamed protein product [Cuscuta epithymum]